MHELAIAKGIIDIVETEAQKRGFERVLEIKLGIGEFSDIVPDCLKEFFPYAAKGTAAENAVLTVERHKARFKCADCGYEGEADRKNACCPVCRSIALKMTSGREFYVDSLKVE